MRGIVFASTTALSIIFASTAFAGSNTVYLGQSGNNQNANITQNGNNNWVGTSTSNPFIQENGSGSGGNKLLVKQSGSSNAIGWLGTAKQSGTNNNADITQDGSGGDVEILQIGTNNGNAGIINNYDSPKGGIYQSGTWGKIAVAQIGSSNDFNIKQAGNTNNTELAQFGSDLKAVVRQSVNGGSDSHIDSVPNARPGYLPYVTASPDYPSSALGAHGTIKINQGIATGSASSDFAYAAQGGGAWNTMTLWQDGTQQTAAVWQKGDGNSAESHQYGYSNSLGKVNGYTHKTAPFFQLGTGNQLVNYQFGHDNVVTGLQNGVSNVVSTVQYGSYSSANFLQDGSTNKAYNTQYDIANASVTQLGSNNYSLGTQSGGGWGTYANNATISQDGSNNSSVYTQSGTANTLTVSQTGSYNASTVAQTGGGNQAVIQQN
ncbi:hypothetical protein QTL95_23945 [Rhizobium sp. S152]|uniref:hypothetical protein n=1 Tax=Rhizobium sp. S152 TaxID=3055038 RepID=UPI0025A950C3|nr:hypothetical protein [Rhizobium sp. S152]MDM9628955.1 hypothetical protein [Rhizobium sp. S152]